ncbi:MAG: hypothetical protein IPK16_19305 [Anaerolineales bacterium]|nr:hypothetical protein [Anaerolineales bacterium]
MTAGITPALQVFEQSLALKPNERTMQAALHFYIGAILPEVKGYRTDVLTDSIEHYNQALALEPTWENILYNRGTTYLGRGLLSPNERADLDQAIKDLTEVIRLQPKRVEPYLNRGIAYYQRNAEGDQATAIADFTHAIELQPRDDRAFYHRGLAEIRNGAAPGIWMSDLEQAQALNPANPAITNGLCWGHAVAAGAEAGLEFCEQAVAADQTGSSLDGRAIVYARLGRPADAANDLRNYLKWVKATYPQLYTKYRGPTVEAWIAALEQGENPFTPEVLAMLRSG